MRAAATMTRLSLATLLTCVLIGGIAWSQDEKKEDKSAKPETHKAKSETFKVEIELDGVFEAENSEAISLRPEEWKTLEVVKAVPHGSSVKKGEVLVQLETQDLDKQIDEVKLSVEQSRLTLAQSELSFKQLKVTMPLDMQLAENAHRDADRTLKYYDEIDKKLSEKSAEQRLKSSIGMLENAQEELDQLEKMYKADDLTEETEEIILKRARRSVESAEFFVEQSKVRTERLLKEEIPERRQRLANSARRQQLALERLQATQPADLRLAEIGLIKEKNALRQSEERLARLVADRKLMTVHAPVDGIVYYGAATRGKWSSTSTIAKQLEPGKSLTANQVFMTVVAVRPMFVRVDVGEKELADVREGAKGKVAPVATPRKKLDCVVQSVGSIPFSTGKFDGKIRVNLGEGGAAAQLVPGMSCKVKLVAYEKKNAVTVPKSAVFEGDDGEEYVLVAKGKAEPERRVVQTGRVNGETMEIVSGLKAGEEILKKKPE